MSAAVEEECEHPSPVLAPSGVIAELKARRVELGLTQAQVGARLYRSGGAVRDWETGRWTPPIDLLAEWARSLGFELGLYEPAAALHAAHPVTLLLNEAIDVLAKALLGQDNA